MKVIRILGRILSILLSILLTVLIISNAYILIVRHTADKPLPTVFGWTWAVVVSGSMSPELEVDDLIVIRAGEDYGINDVVVFEDGKSVTTHRIVDIGDRGYITRGDANNTNDLDPVPEEAIIGRVVFRIPGFGIAAEYLRTPLGMTCAVLLMILLLNLSYIIQKNRIKKGDSV